MHTSSLAAISALSLAALTRANPLPKNHIEWGDCEEGEFNTTLPIQCASIKVPLDYTAPNSTTFDLGLVKIPATKQPSRGSILFNFGGPGEEARQSLLTTSETLIPESGGVYDFVAFDPRGVGKTMPFVCTEERIYIGNILGESRSIFESENIARRQFLRGKVDNSICQTLGKGNETAEYIGTAFTARDFISVVDALDEDGMLRYWGFSYGTTLGATLAAMFPERIDKMVIDGVQNPHEYYHEHADYEEWLDTDKVFSHYLDTCIEAGADLCPLAALNKSARQLEDDTYAFFDSLVENPIPGKTSLGDLFTIKGTLLGSLKAYKKWPGLASILAGLVYGTPEEQSAIIDSVGGQLSDDAPAFNLIADATWAIHGSDRLVRAQTFEEIKPVYDRLGKISRFTGDVAASFTSHCSQWPWHAKEVYKGNFQVKTKNPILVASNLYDAHTPLTSAKNVSDTFEGSGLLVVNGTGHATLSVPSVCGLQKTAAYWVNGTLPEPGFVCDAPSAWSGVTWPDVIKAAESGNSTIA